MDWQKQIVRRVMHSGEEFPGVQLHFLIQRLEAHPACIPAIAAAVEDMGHWYADRARELENEVARRNGRNVLNLPSVETEPQT